MFFGESNLLTCVAGGVIGPDSTHPPDVQDSEPVTNGRSQSCATPEEITASSRKTRHLQEDGAFGFPSLEDSSIVLQAYFQWFHPCFPVLHRSDTARLHASGDLSPLLLQAMLFVGSTYADESIIQRIGFTDRRQAKSQLYDRARLLFEAEVEPNRFIMLQAAFLLSFRRTGPTEVKDVRYWLSIAITLAQSYGLHRSYVTCVFYFENVG